jgi:ACS family hexuronate transporter-like MFS transporter
MWTEAGLRAEVLDYQAQTRGKMSHVRWVVCALLFVATTINYLDRQVLATLKPTLQSTLHFDDAAYGWINFAFTAGYAIMYVFAGKFVDWIGTRRGLAIAVAVWSLASMGHSLVMGAVGFGVARFILSMGEAANFPAAIKATALWFPKKERALATGLFNSGSNVGLMLTPPIVYMAIRIGWQSAFIVTGLFGLAWLAWWLYEYQAPADHHHVSPGELEYIRGDGADPAVQKAKIPWTTLVRERQVWPFLIGKFMTDPVWWFFLAWMPSYLHDVRKMSTLSSATMLLIPYSAASVGSILGGWISSKLIRGGWNVAAARYAAMGVSAVCMPISIYAGFTDQKWTSIALISLALASHQGWSANIFTTATDMFPAAVAGAVVGLGGTAGAIGGMLMNLIAGAVIQKTGQYGPMFVWAGLMYPLSLLIYFAFVGTTRTQADIVHKPHGMSPPLLVSGAVIALIGMAGVILTYANWGYLVVAMKGTSGAAAGVAAPAFVVIIGLLLLYAGVATNSADIRGFPVVPLSDDESTNGSKA